MSESGEGSVVEEARGALPEARLLNYIAGGDDADAGEESGGGGGGEYRGGIFSAGGVLPVLHGFHFFEGPETGCGKGVWLRRGVAGGAEERQRGGMILQWSPAFEET